MGTELHKIYFNEEIDENQFFNFQKKYFISKALEMGFSIIDLEPPFSNHYRIHMKKFHIPFDGHWTELGHQIVANEIINFLEFKNKK